MAFGKCRECGREVAKSARVCPGCGVASPVKGWTPGSKLGLVLIALVIVWMVVTAGDKSAAKLNPVGAVADIGMDGITRKVATDAVAQYEIAKRGGAGMDICVHAGMVAAAFLQAKDEGNYKTWRQTEKAACDGAGVPGH